MYQNMNKTANKLSTEVNKNKNYKLKKTYVNIKNAAIKNNAQHCTKRS